MTKFEELVKRGSLEIMYRNNSYILTHLVETKDSPIKARFFTFNENLVKALQELWDKEEYLFHS